MTDYMTIPAITVLCYLMAEVYKNIVSEDKYKHIPVLCGLLGLLLALLAHLFLPGWIPAENVLVAAAIGAVSGFAATGAHQIIKQEVRS